jgi:hypothetical protein
MRAKYFALFAGVFLCCACHAASTATQYDQKRLADIPFNLSNAPSTRPAIYDYRTVRQVDGKTESAEYGILVTSTLLDKGRATFHDTITVGAKAAEQAGENAPKDFSWVFDRTMDFAPGNLLVPREITIDMTITANGKTQNIRQYTYKNGKVDFVDESGQDGSGPLDFSGGILSFNALLRLAPLLPQTLGSVYTFKCYAEGFLFRMHTAQNSDPVFTLRCESVETISIAHHRHDCIKFVMELKSAQTKTEIWIDKSSEIVVKFADGIPDSESSLEATLRE